MLGGMLVLFLMVILYRCEKKRSKRKQEFCDLTVYMEQIICSYKQNKMLVKALEECTIVFPANNMIGELLRNTLHMLKTGEGVDGNQFVSKALKNIQNQYNSIRLQRLHQLIERAETEGTDVWESLSAYLDDIRRWKMDMIIFQERMETMRLECFFSSFWAYVLFCLSYKIMPRSLSETLGESVYYLCFMVVLCLIIAVVTMLMAKSATGTWLDETESCFVSELREIPFNLQLYRSIPSVLAGLKIVTDMLFALRLIMEKVW